MMDYLTTPNVAVTIGIDASRNRSGGAKAHLIGILSECDPPSHGIQAIHVWAFRSLLEQLPDYPWLVKHNPAELEMSLIHQLFWQATQLSREVKDTKCDILFTTDASTVCFFKPMVVLSQDMLSYESGVMQYFGYGKQRARLVAILYLQNWAFRRAQGVIFLTHYAGMVIQQSAGFIPNVTYIPHGVGNEFHSIKSRHSWPSNNERPIQCLYISNTAPYKHQWIVVQAVEQLRNKGINLQLRLVGGGEGLAQKRLENQILLSDPDRSFVLQTEFIPQSMLPSFFQQADIFVFASSCENMPITLVEAMAAGIPIACSNRGPMPEVLSDGGVYFNPEDAVSIAAAIEQIILLPSLRETIAQRGRGISQAYSWTRCASETFKFITDSFFKSKI